MKIEEIYKILTADHFDGETVYKTCLNGPINTGSITIDLCAGYTTSMIIHESGEIYIDYIVISEEVLHGYGRTELERLRYTIPIDKIRTFVVTSVKEEGSYNERIFHRPVIFRINHPCDSMV